MKCIGQFGGGYGTWYAELHFCDGAARIRERRQGGDVPIGMAYLVDARFSLDEDGDSELDPRSKQAQRVMWLVNAKDAHETLRAIVEAARKGIADAGTSDGDPLADLLGDLADMAEETLGRACVPSPEHPRNIAAMGVGPGVGA